MVVVRDRAYPDSDLVPQAPARHPAVHHAGEDAKPLVEAEIPLHAVVFIVGSPLHLFIARRVPLLEDAFQWPPERLAFVPFHTDPRFVVDDYGPDEGFVMAAGRTFRDYATLVEAFEGLDVPLVIVASPSNPGLSNLTRSVTLKYDLPGPELAALMSRSLVVALPLESRQISIGQSVLLQAMAMGKPVIVTKVNGTEDYVEHMRTGILVPPNDQGALREAVVMLVRDAGLRERLGRAALDRVKQQHLPQHYADGVSRRLRRRSGGARH